MDHYSQKILNFGIISPECSLMYAKSYVSDWMSLLSWAPKSHSWVEKQQKHFMETVCFLTETDRSIFNRQTLCVQDQAELPFPTESCPALWESNDSRTISSTFQENVGLTEFLTDRSQGPIWLWHQLSVNATQCGSHENASHSSPSIGRIIDQRPHPEIHHLIYTEATPPMSCSSQWLSVA